MAAIETIDIQVKRKGIQKKIEVVQNDTDRVIKFRVTDMTIPAGYKGRVYVRKPSGKEVYNDETNGIVTIAGNIVTVKLTSQTLAEAGIAQGQIQIIQGMQVISSFVFSVNIEKSLASSSAIQSTNEYGVLDNLIKDAQNTLVQCEAQLTDMKNQASLIGDGNIGTSSSSTHTLPTSKGAALLRELPGITDQVVTTGAQLLNTNYTDRGDVKTTIEESGKKIKVEVSLQGSYRYAIFPVLTSDRVTELLGKTIYVNWKSYSGTGQARFALYFSDEGTGLKDQILLTVEKNKAVVIPNTLPSGATRIVVVLYAVSSAEGTVGQYITYEEVTVSLSSDTTWEPYTGGKPGPNPDYPQRIQGVGDSGWFDGELLQGAYAQSTGAFVNGMRYACGPNFIPCRQNDKITVIYGENTEYLSLQFYREDKTFLSSLISDKNVNTYTGAVPAGASYFHFSIQCESGKEIFINQAKHIAVLKNGKYVVQVKSCGKNLCKLFGRCVFVNESGKEEVVESKNRYMTSLPIHLKKGESLTISYNSAVNTTMIKEFIIYTFANNNFTGSTMITGSYSPPATYTAKEDEWFVLTIGNGATKVEIPISVFESIQIEKGPIVTNYEPYKESTTYIELDQPLYTGDRIYLEDGHLWEYRENAVVEYDGSTDEGWETYRSLEQNEGLSFCINVAEKQNGTQTSLCTYFRNIAPSYAWEPKFKDEFGIYSDHPETGYIYFRRPSEEINTLTLWRTWLASHPITVVYKLAAPTKTRLNQPAAYGLRTYGEQTHIYIPDALEPEFSVDYPLNPAGGYALDGFCQSRINEAQEEINRQALDDRIAKIEVDLGANTFIVE